MLPQLPHRPESGFDAVLGVEYLELGEDLVRARAPVTDALKQPFGLVHGGVLAAVAESVASVGTVAAVSGRGALAMGMSNHTSFLRPVTEGTLHAVARARHRGRSTWVWDVEIHDDHHRLCALSRMTVAVREAA